MTQNLFVTGAGTDIGKTWVCCRILRALLGRVGLRCVKPVVSGFDPVTAADSDPGRLLAAQGLVVDETGIEAISPWRFRAAVSADMAAAREQRTIDFEQLVQFSRSPADVSINMVEGIGGVMAPVDDKHTVLDWIAAMPARALLVTGSYLGSLSHTLTALSALRQRGIEVAAVVVSQSPEEPVPVEDTAATLQGFCNPVPVMIFRRNKEPSATEMAALVQQIFP